MHGRISRSKIQGQARPAPAKALNEGPLLAVKSVIITYAMLISLLHKLLPILTRVWL